MAVIISSPTLALEKRKLARRTVLTEAHVSDPGVVPLPAAQAVCVEADADSVAREDVLLEQIRSLESRVKELEAEQQHALERSRTRGHEEGYETGMSQGLEEGRGAYLSGHAALDRLAADLSRKVDSDLALVEDSVVAIAFEAVCKLIGETLVTPEGIAARVRELLQRVRDKDRLTIRLHPQDLELIEERETFGLDSSAEVDWVADEALDAGSCIIGTAAGTLEARLDEQLGLVKSVLLAVRNQTRRGEQ